MNTFTFKKRSEKQENYLHNFNILYNLLDKFIEEVTKK